MTPTRGEVYRTLATWAVTRVCNVLPSEAAFNLLWISDHFDDSGDAYARFTGELNMSFACYQTDDQCRNWLRRDLAKLAWALEHGCLQPDMDAVKTEGHVRRVFSNVRNWLAGLMSSDEHQDDTDQAQSPSAATAPPHVPFDCYVSFVRWWDEGRISFAECEGIVHHLTQLDAEVGSRSWSPLEQRFQNAVDAALSQPDDHESALRACEAALRMLESEPETGHTPTV